MTFAATVHMIAPFQKGVLLWKLEATIIYVISDEVLRLLKVNDDNQSKMSNAEVITFAILTARFFVGNYKKARYFCKRLGLFPRYLKQQSVKSQNTKYFLDLLASHFPFLSLPLQKCC